MSASGTRFLHVIDKTGLRRQRVEALAQFGLQSRSQPNPSARNCRHPFSREPKHVQQVASRSTGAAFLTRSQIHDAGRKTLIAMFIPTVESLRAHPFKREWLAFVSQQYRRGSATILFRTGFRLKMPLKTLK